MHYTGSRTLVHVSAAEAPYHKALQEAVARELSGAGFTAFHIILPDRQAAKNADFSPQAAHPAAPNLELHQLKTGSFRKRHGNFWPSSELWPLLCRLNPALIWSHEYSLFNWPALLFARRRRRPLIVSTEIGCSNLADMGMSARFTRCWFGPWVNGIIANSPAAMQACESIPEQRIAQAWYAGATQADRPISRTNFDAVGRLRVVFLGQMIPRKGIDLLLRAVQQAEKSGRRFRLTFVGKPTEWSEQILSQYPGESEIVRAGFLEEKSLADTLAQQDVFVLPSRYDTYGAVVHEAASSGLGLIISKNAGAARLLAEMEPLGRVVDPEKSDEFAAALDQYFDQTLLSCAKTASRTMADKFSNEANAFRVVNLFQEVLHELP